MSGAYNVLHSAASRIGYYAPDDPEPGSEAGRYCAKLMGEPWLAGPSTDIWWCMCFVTMCFDENGELETIGGASYNTEVTRSRTAGQHVGLYDGAPGDVVLFDWAGDGATDHVGIVEANLGDGWYQTIEGNTSGSWAGSQSAGNGVWRRQRHVSDGIAVMIRPNWDDDAESEANEPAVTDDGKLVVDGWAGEATIGLAQEIAWGERSDSMITGQWIGTEVYHDNITAISYDDGGSDLVRDIQTALGVTPDGYLGAETVRGMQARLGVSVDSYAGPDTISAWQRRLNEGSLI